MTSVPPTQPPAAPETDVRLTEAERKALLSVEHDLAAIAVVERIVAERVRVVEGERDALRIEAEVLSDWRYCPACGRDRDWSGETSPGAPCMGCGRYPAARAESAEAAHRALQARIDTLATGMLHEADHLDQLGDHEEAGSVRHYGHAIHTILRASEAR